MARSLLQQKAINLLSEIGTITSTMVSNLSNVVGANVTTALNTLKGQVESLTSSDISNDSNIVGVTVTDALNNVIIGNFDTTDITNVSNIIGATCTDALNNIDNTISSLTSSNISNNSNVIGANLTDALNTIDSNIALLAPITSPSFLGTPRAPTAPNGTNTTQIATTAFVQDAISGGISYTYLKYVETINDFPAPVGGVITLVDNTAYYITTEVDLVGNRLIGGRNTAMIGSSSEISKLKSTGLIGTALITSQWSLSMRNINIEANIALDLNALGNPGQALDWVLTNFTNCPTVGTIRNYNNFIYTQGAFNGSEGLTFDGTMSTIAFGNALFVGIGSKAILTIAPTAVISRRVRLNYSSFIVPLGSTGINFSVLATIPVESYILDTVNFSDNGTYLAGVLTSSNSSLFVNCKGIDNTSVNGQMYMQNNVTTTPIANTVNFFKILGTTTASADNQKYTMTNNRLTCEAVIERKYLVCCTLSFTSGSGNVCQFGFYDSTLASLRLPSRTLSTANASGRAENISFFCVIQHSMGDYIEVWCRNTSAINNITVTDLNVVITEIN